MRISTDGKFKFTVPEGHPEAGTEIKKTFEYKVCESESEALEVLQSKKDTSIVTLVNDMLKSNARNAAYQAALLPYKPSEVSPKDIKERMVRDYIRLGVSEENARKQVESLLAAKV